MSIQSCEVQIERLIAAHDKDGSIMAEYQMLRGESEEAKAIHARSASFLEIRAWFLKTFPAIEAFYTKRAALLTKPVAKPETKAADSNTATTVAA